MPGQGSLVLLAPCRGLCSRAEWCCFPTCCHAFLLEPLLPGGLCLALHRAGPTAEGGLPAGSDSLGWEVGSGWAQGMLRLVKVLLGRK